MFLLLAIHVLVRLTLLDSRQQEAVGPARSDWEVEPDTPEWIAQQGQREAEVKKAQLFAKYLWGRHGRRRYRLALPPSWHPPVSECREQAGVSTCAGVNLLS